VIGRMEIKEIFKILGKDRDPRGDLGDFIMNDTIRNRYSDILDEIRSVLSNGADEELWPPGLSLSEAVARLRDEWIFLKEYARTTGKEASTLRDENGLLRDQVADLRDQITSLERIHE